MKKQFKILILCQTALLLTGTCFGQAGYSFLPHNMSNTNETTTATRSTSFNRTKELLGAEVKDTQNQKLGDIYDIVFNPKTGQSFAAISVGHDSYALVPPQALTITPGNGILSHKDNVTLNATKETLQSAPTIANDDWQKLDTTSFTQGIYSHYNVQGPTAVGGVSPSSLGGVLKEAVTNHFK